MHDTSLRDGDILIRPERRTGGWAFLLRAIPGPDQFILPTRDAAVATAMKVARREHVCVWMVDANGAFTLLHDFRGTTMRNTIERIQAEFAEMPGLRLTPPQIQRLCGVDPVMCAAVLDALVDANFLTRRSDGKYARRSEGPVHPAPGARSGARSLSKAS